MKQHHACVQYIIPHKRLQSPQGELRPQLLSCCYCLPVQQTTCFRQEQSGNKPDRQFMYMYIYTQSKSQINQPTPPPSTPLWPRANLCVQLYGCVCKDPLQDKAVKTKHDERQGRVLWVTYAPTTFTPIARKQVIGVCCKVAQKRTRDWHDL